MKIKMWLPVYASAEFEADIEIEGKSNEEIFNEFCDQFQPTGYICHHCRGGLETDFEATDYVFEIKNEKGFADEIGNIISK